MPCNGSNAVFIKTPGGRISSGDVGCEVFIEVSHLKHPSMNIEHSFKGFEGVCRVRISNEKSISTAKINLQTITSAMFEIMYLIEITRCAGTF